MNLHIIEIDNQSIAVWQNENSVWQFCTGANKTLKANLTGGYDFSKCGRFDKWNNELESTIEFEFSDIDKIVCNGHINYKITEEFYIATLIESDNAYTSELFADNDLFDDNEVLFAQFYTSLLLIGITPNSTENHPEQSDIEVSLMKAECY